MSILDELAAYARQRVEQSKQEKPLEEVKREALSMPRGDFRFERALRKEGGAVICEVKKASPSKGIISEVFPYLDIAREYERCGADCVSCLTEPKWFLGSDEIFKSIRAEISLPMIRKDFTVDEYQIYEAKLMGADAVLLICAILDEDRLTRYLAVCEELGVTALVETHSEEEIKTAVRTGARVIGVNNRDLRNFTINFDNALTLREHIPDDRIFVAESGVASPADGAMLLKNGADAVLIGEALMRSSDKGAFIGEMLGR